MVYFNGISIGANELGLFSLCCGDDDNGIKIDAYFEGKTSNFGMHNAKRFRYLYFTFEANEDDDLEVDVYVDQGDSRTYDILAHKSGQQRSRVPIERLNHGGYWAFRVKNVDGKDFSMDSIKGLPIVRSNGITQGS